MAYDQVVVWKDAKGHQSAFPGWTREDGLLVDLTDFEGHFDMEWLRTAGVPENVIESACESKPQGYALLGN